MSEPIRSLSRKMSRRLSGFWCRDQLLFEWVVRVLAARPCRAQGCGSRRSGVPGTAPWRPHGDAGVRRARADPRAVTLSLRDELQGAVAMLRVVPSDEARDPAARAGETVERLGGKVGSVLERLQQRLGVGVVVARRRSAERGYHRETLQGREHGGALHRRAIVRMQTRGSAWHAFALMRPGEVRRGVLGALLFEDLPTDDLATEHAYNPCNRNKDFA
jgi:hypothetical protein